MFTDLARVPLKHLITGQTEPALFGQPRILDILILPIQRVQHQRQLLIQIHQALFGVLYICLAVEVEFDLFEFLVELPDLLVGVGFVAHATLEVADRVDELATEVVKFVGVLALQVVDSFAEELEG